MRASLRPCSQSVAGRRDEVVFALCKGECKGDCEGDREANSGSNSDADAEATSDDDDRKDFRVGGRAWLGGAGMGD
jgi:hypothetical protein